MSKQKLSSKSVSKTITVLSIVLILLIVAVAMIPFLTTYYTDYNNRRSWESSSGTNTDASNKTLDNITELDENYDLNYTPDRSYEINDCSYLDYKSTYNNDLTKNGEPYFCNDGRNYMKIVVTNETGAPIPNKNLVLTAYAKRTSQMLGTTIGLTTGALVGAVIGLQSGGPPGALIGLIIGAVVGGAIGYWQDNSMAESITFFNKETINANDGDSFNEVGFGLFGGWATEQGYYADRHILIELPEDTLQYYSPFAVTNEIVVEYNAVIYVRLVNGDQQLMNIQRDIKNDPIYQGERDCNNQGYGLLEGSPPLWGGHDSFRGLDTANASSYSANISLYDNSHVYRIHEKRLISTKDISGIDLHTYPAGVFGISIIFIDEDNNTIQPEQGYPNWIGIGLNNVTKFGIGYTVSLENNKYYTIDMEYIISTQSDYLQSILYIQYQHGGTDYIEYLGRQILTWDHAQYITAFSFKYNVFFSGAQQIHRSIYDINDKIQLMCDFNSPFYLNETQSTFKLRFFVAVGGIDALFPSLDGNYPIHVLMEIADGSDVIISEEQDIIIPPSGISYALFDNIELSGSGITELTSYQLRVSCYSGLVTATTQYAIYSTALYYVLKNFNEFMTEVRNLDDIIESITNGSDLSSGTYDTLREVMGLTKTKINDLESSLETLRAEYPEEHDGIYDQCTKAIKQFRDYFVWLSAFMDQYAPETVSADPALFTQFKGYILDLRFWYSDAFTQYNSYIAGLKGEDQISDDIGNITKGYEDDYQKKYNADRNNDLNKFLPALVVLFALLIAFIISAIAYYGFRRKLSSPVLCAILAIVVFGISAIVLYLFLLSISGMVLNWFYLGGS